MKLQKIIETEQFWMVMVAQIWLRTKYKGYVHQYNWALEYKFGIN